MRILILLLIFVFNYVVNSQQIITGEMYYTKDVCHNGIPSTPTPKIFCPTESHSQYNGGFIVKENTCMYIGGISTFPTTYTVSSGSSISENKFENNDYFCSASKNSTSYNQGVCYEECTQDAQGYIFNLVAKNDLELPDKAIISINSNSETCGDDFKSTFNFIYYNYIKTCTNTGSQSFILDCADNYSQTVYLYNCNDCSCNPTSASTVPLKKQCDSFYQICNI